MKPLDANEQAPIFIAKRGELNPRAIQDLRKAGYVVVETEDPNNVRLVSTNFQLDGHDLFLCGLRAVAEHSPHSTKEAFCNLLLAALDPN